MSKLFTLVASLALAGCANQILSDDHIRRETATALNVSDPGTIAISDRRYDGWATTSYVAVLPVIVPGKKRNLIGMAFRCSIDGGNLHTFGLTNPPVCARL